MSDGPTPKPVELGVNIDSTSTTCAGDVSIPIATPATYCHSAACTPCRPWRELINRGAFSLPPTLADALLRIRTNLSYFAANYTILLVIYLLLWNPVALLVFLAMRLPWLRFYVRTDAPLLFFGKEVGKGVVAAVITGVTIGLMLLMGAGLRSVLFVTVVILGHATMRKTDDLYVEEAAGVGEGGRRENHPLSP